MELVTNAAQPVAGTHNLRDTGGYKAITGHTRWGKLYRSDALHLVTDGGLEKIAALRLGHIIDLRDDSELASSPSRLNGVNATVHHVPIFSRPITETSDATGVHHLAGLTLSSLYRMMLDDFAPNLVAAVRIIAASKTEAVLVHCTAGKDRTGIVVALALLAAGVERAAVTADYAATEANLRGEWTASMLQKMVDSGLPLSPELEQIVSASPATVIEDIIGELETAHGSAENFLLANGLTADEIIDLRVALVEPQLAHAKENQS